MIDLIFVIFVFFRFITKSQLFNQLKQIVTAEGIDRILVRG